MEVSQEFAGKVALVTGAGSGIGRASALAFARRGAAVMVSDISEDAGKAVVAEIESAGGRAAFQRADATSEDDVKALMDATLRSFGRLDMAHNNVGHSWGTGVEGITVEEWDATVAISMKAPWLCMKHELPIMVAQGGGRIVNTASMAGVTYTGVANAVYSAAKAGVLHMTRYVANAYAAQNIRANAVSPGLTRTPAIAALMTPEEQNQLAASSQPIGRIVEATEIADAVIWLCSDASAMVTGENICVAGGHQAH